MKKIGTQGVHLNNFEDGALTEIYKIKDKKTADKHCIPLVNMFLIGHGLPIPKLLYTYAKFEIYEVSQEYFIMPEGKKVYKKIYMFKPCNVET